MRTTVALLLATLLTTVVLPVAEAVDLHPGGVKSLTGTANQVSVSAATGAVTLSTPQDIATASTPTFGGMTLNGTLVMGTNSVTHGTGNAIVGVVSGIMTLTSAAQVLISSNAAANGIYFSENEINSGYNANSDTYPTVINGSGYLGGTTKYRNFRISDGHGVILFSIIGSTGSIQIMPTIIPSANQIPLSVSGYSITGSGVRSMLDLAGTLNTSGVLDVVKLAITDTAHGTGSNMLAMYGGAAGATAIFTVGVTGMGFQAGILFANLGTPANGSFAFCSDCDPPTLVDSTCASAGAKTGSFAVRVNSTWKCLG